MLDCEDTGMHNYKLTINAIHTHGSKIICPLFCIGLEPSKVLQRPKMVLISQLRDHNWMPLAHRP